VSATCFQHIDSPLLFNGLWLDHVSVLLAMVRGELALA
jgi:hypothetical protein